MGYTIESLRDGDAEARYWLGRQAFGGTYGFDPDGPNIAHEKVVAAYHGDRLAGTVVTLDLSQTWGGRSVQCGGVSGVTVAPEDRGAGLARRMLHESFDRMAARGMPISALYPTTVTLYRSTGFEVVGMFARRWLELSSIPGAGDRSVTWSRVDFDDARILDLVSRHAARHDGWIRPDPDWWALRSASAASDSSVNRYAYLGSLDDDPVVGLVFGYTSASGTRDMFDLTVDVLAVADESHLAAALGFLAGHTTTAGRAQTTLPDAVLARHLPHPQRSDHAQEWPWMLRIVDAPGAIAARGYPSVVSGSVALEITDDVRPANSGSFVLDVGAGSAKLTPGGTDGIPLTIQDLAVVYAGGTSSLVAAGRLPSASTDDLDLLRAAFVSNPTIPFFF